MSGIFTYFDVSDALLNIELKKFEIAMETLNYCEMRDAESDYCYGLFFIAKGTLNYKLKNFYEAAENFDKAYNILRTCSEKKYPDISYQISVSLLMTLKSAIKDRQEQHLIRFYHDRVTEHSIDETFKKRADYVIEGRFQNWIDDIYNV